MKHLWILIARDEDVKNKGSWLNLALKSEDLPFKVYSYQVLFFLGAVPIGILVFMWWTTEISLSPTNEDWRKFWMAIYISESLVLFRMAKLRGYFGHDPRWLLSTRIFLTVPVALVLPIVFGFMCYPWVMWDGLGLIGVLGLGIAWTYPFCAVQGLIIFAQKGEWVTREERPEVYRAKLWVQKVCLPLTFFLMVALLWLSSRHLEFFQPFIEKFHGVKTIAKG